MVSKTNKPEMMTEKRGTCMRLLLQRLNRNYETRFRYDKLLGWTRNVGGVLFSTRRYDIVTTKSYGVTIYQNVLGSKTAEISCKMDNSVSLLTVQHSHFKEGLTFFNIVKYPSRRINAPNSKDLIHTDKQTEMSWYTTCLLQNLFLFIISSIFLKIMLYITYLSVQTFIKSRSEYTMQGN